MFWMSWWNETKSNKYSRPTYIDISLYTYRLKIETTPF